MAYDRDDLRKIMYEAIQQAELDAIERIKEKQVFINIQNACLTQAQAGKNHHVVGVVTEPDDFSDYVLAFKSLEFKLKALRPADGAAYISLAESAGLNPSSYEVIVYIGW